MDEIKCLKCKEVVKPPQYMEGIAYQGRVRCSNCNSLLYMDIDRTGEMMDFRIEERTQKGEAGAIKLTPEDYKQMLANPEQFAKKVFERMKADQEKAEKKS